MAQVLHRRWRRNQHQGDFFFVSNHRIGGARPGAQLVQNLRDVPIASNGNRVAIKRRDRLQSVTRLDTGLIGRSIGRNRASLDPGGTLNPYGPVVRRNKPPLLLGVQSPKNEDRHCQQDRRDIFKGEDLPAH
jgi:hypothetical protein